MTEIKRCAFPSHVVWYVPVNRLHGSPQLNKMCYQKTKSRLGVDPDKAKCGYTHMFRTHVYNSKNHYWHSQSNIDSLFSCFGTKIFINNITYVNQSMKQKYLSAKSNQVLHSSVLRDKKAGSLLLSYTKYQQPSQNS